MPVKMRAKKKPAPGTFGAAIRNRRHQLGLTQAQVAKKVRCRPNYIGYLESGARHPSQKLVFRLAKALDLDAQELFLLANPMVREVLQRLEEPVDVNQAFLVDKGLHTRHNISWRELRALAEIGKLGPFKSKRDFLHILQAIRTALTDA